MDRLPTRRAARPITTDGAHHAQVDVEPDASLLASLAARCFAIDGVEENRTQVSVPGTRALWVAPDIPIVHGSGVHGREFAHLHPDGSLHVSLPADRANEVIDQAWGEAPPEAHQAHHPGRVMLYTALDHDEVEVIAGLVRESFDHVTGQVRDV